MCPQHISQYITCSSFANHHSRSLSPSSLTEFSGHTNHRRHRHPRSLGRILAGQQNDGVVYSRRRHCHFPPSSSSSSRGPSLGSTEMRSGVSSRCQTLLFSDHPAATTTTSAATATGKKNGGIIIIITTVVVVVRHERQSTTTTKSTRIVDRSWRSGAIAVARGLVRFPCRTSLSNVYHFLRSGSSLLEVENVWSTNPLFLRVSGRSLPDMR